MRLRESTTSSGQLPSFRTKGGQSPVRSAMRREESIIPRGLAAETDGSMWVANYGSSSVTLLTSMGTAGPGVCNSAGCGYSSASTDFPDAIAVDANHFVWVASAPTDYLTRISPDGTQMLPVDCCSGADALAIDAGGYVWAANQRGNSVSLVSNDGAVISNGYTGGGISNPHGIAVDGAGNVWVTKLSERLDHPDVRLHERHTRSIPVATNGVRK